MPSRDPVVLFEDDATLRELMADGLRDSGYDVVEAPTAADAERALERVGGRAVLVADRAVGANAANGFAVAGEALDRYPALKVVYVSGTHAAVRQRRVSERERGLLKPFALSQLVSAIRELG